MRTMLFAAVLAAAVGAPALAQESRMLAGFNSEADVSVVKWSSSVKTAFTTEHATEGAGAVRATFPGERKLYGGFQITDAKLMAGWDAWDLVTFDVFNPGDEIVTMTIRIDDERTGGDDYSTWYTGSFKAFPGANHIEIGLAKLSAPRFGRLHLPKLAKFILWTEPTDKPKDLIFDALALRKFEKTALPKEMLAFDFGGEKSNVCPGFTLVTEKMKFDDARGFGFTSATELIPVEDQERAAEPLGQDAVSTWEGQKLSFAVKLADGKYHLWAATGFVNGYNWPRKPYTVTANGKEVFRWAPKTLDFREASDPLAYEYSPKADLWKMFVVGKLFDEWEADVDVKGGKLELTITPEGNTPSRIRGLAIWPAGNAECAKAMADVNARRVASFNKQWREIRPASVAKAPGHQDDDPTKPFRIGKVGTSDTVTPYAGVESMKPIIELQLAGAQGQTVSSTVVIWPYKDLAEVAVDVPALGGPDGFIPRDAIEVSTIQLRYVRKGEDGYAVEPTHLVRRKTMSGSAGVPLQVWLNVRIPQDLPPGKYMGHVQVQADGVGTRIPLRVDVYRFKLDTPADHGITYAHAYSCGRTPAEIEMDLRCLQEHGSNSVTPGGAIALLGRGPDGKCRFDFSRLDMLMDAMKKLGMTGPVPLFDQSVQGEAGGKSYPHISFLRKFGYKLESQAYLDDLTDLTSQLIARAKEKNYLPIIMYPSTEISNDPAVGPAFNSKLIAAIRKAGDVKCISSVNHPEDVATAKELDCVMINFGVGINDETIKKIHDSGAKLWFQNVGQTRYTDGLFMLRTGAVGRRQWVAGWWTADPYSDWDGGESTSLIFPSPKETLPSIRLEWMREGVDDLRYFLTLKRLIGEARKAGRVAEADAAQKAYDEMLATCPVQLPGGAAIMPDGLAVMEGFSDKTVFDRYRRRAAEEIMKLLLK